MKRKKKKKNKFLSRKKPVLKTSIVMSLDS